MIFGVFVGSLISSLSPKLSAENVTWSALRSPIIFRGDATTAYRDPAMIYHDGWFRLFFTLVKIESDGKIFAYTAWSRSRNLVSWSDPVIFTPRDQRLNFSSPGNIVRDGEDWVLCLQTYPRPNGEKFGTSDSRLWVMRSRDLEHWSEPELLRVRGPDVSQEAMGRMIDPYLLLDQEKRWWCFYKGGVSWSPDLKVWTPAKRVRAGENPCVIRDGSSYVMFHAHNVPDGISVMRSEDLRSWKDEEVLTLGQASWPWAQGRLTAGFVIDLRDDPEVGKAVMVFHGSDFPESDPRGGFDNFASIGLAWSDDLRKWDWPGKGAGDE